MSDLDIIRQIEAQIKAPLKKMTQEELTKNSWNFLYAYSSDENDNVTGLFMDGLSDFSKHEYLLKLKHIEMLSLKSTKISDYSFLSELKGLTSLDLRSNQISDVSFVADLPNLSNLDIDGNPNLTEPPEDIRQKGAEAIRNYFLQLRKQGEDFLYEAKVLFVGEPGAGKTLLMKKILNPNYEVPSKIKEKSTLGIKIKTWNFDYFDQKPVKFSAHLWDFGGQNIQYYLHQFFLTEDSVYVLLVEDRKDCPKLAYWLNIIRILGKGSPVIIINSSFAVKYTLISVNTFR